MVVNVLRQLCARVSGLLALSEFLIFTVLLAYVEFI